MSNLSNINFEKINEIVYANEENVVKELLEYLTPEYSSRLNNIKVRAGEIVTSARKSIWMSGIIWYRTKSRWPNYLLKFVNEKTYSYDATAAGGNATLFMLSDNQ